MVLTLVLQDEEIKDLLANALERDTHYRVSNVHLARKKSGQFLATYTVMSDQEYMPMADIGEAKKENEVSEDGN